MVKYEVSFKFDLDEILDQADSNRNVEIEELNDECFYDLFSTDEKVKMFEEWYNDCCDSDEDKIIVKDIIYEGDWEDSANVILSLENELPEDQINNLKNAVIEYLFEDDTPDVSVHEFGVDWRPRWDGYRQEPSEEKYEYDNYETYNINSYYDVKIEKL